MAKRKMTAEEELKTLEEKLCKEYSHWRQLYENGGNDPFWSDGCNLWLTKNHTLYYKRQIETICQENNLPLPEAYFWAELPDVDKNYMAKAKEIRSKAREILREWEDNMAYKELLDMEKELTESIKKDIGFFMVKDHVNTLRVIIEKDDLITMRRFLVQSNHYEEDFAECIAKAKEWLMQKEFIQLSLF